MSDPARSSPSPPVRPEQRGVVLLVDDEDAIRWVGRRFLEADGWAVLEATDGLDALHIVEGLTGRLDLVITDLNMPRVTGRELAEVLSVFRPRLPVLGVTGFLSAVDHDRRLPILPKPFTAESLLQAVRMACGLSLRLRPPVMENRRRARRLRELTAPGAEWPVDLVAAVQTLREIEVS
jgi:two-component system, cell cycle sensor histidine kinase and response regulator CckA